MHKLIFFKEAKNEIVLSRLVKILNAQDETFVTQISFNDEIVRVYVAYGPMYCSFLKEIVILNGKIASTTLPAIEKYKVVYDLFVNEITIINDFKDEEVHNV